MPRAISTALKNHKAQRVTTTCRCWRIRRTDGANEGWTEHDRELSINTGEGEGTLAYRPMPSGTPSNYQQGAELSPANLDLEMAFGGSIEDQFRAGLYDYAEVWTFEVNWADLSQGILRLAYGRLGEVSLAVASVRCELRGLAQLLSAQIGEIYMSECPATIGDARCKLDLAPLTHAGVVSYVWTGATGRRTFRFTGAAAGKANNYYTAGNMTWSTGANAGLTMAIEYSRNVAGVDSIVLLDPMPYAIALGDTFTAHRGCDRRWATCKGMVSLALQGGGTTEGAGLGNRKNFRGAPGLPGPDAVFNVPANSQWTSG